MDTAVIIGFLLVIIAGLAMGTGAWPIKVIEKKYAEFKFEHFWFIGMLLGLIVFPWVITIACIGFGGVSEVIKEVGWGPIIMGNIFSFAWGIANVLCGLCFVRIGVGLTSAILTGLGSSVAVIFPMVLKGTGSFKDAPGLNTPAGVVVICGVAIMLCGVIFCSFAGFGRSAVLGKEEEEKKGSFLGGLIMTVIAGVCSAGLMLSSVYSQGPIVSAVESRGMSGLISAFAVSAIAVLAGALVNIIYPIYLMTKNKSWGTLIQGGPQVFLAAMIGIQMCVSTVLITKGMILLGAIGASVGAGIQQAMQMFGAQGVGFIGGEWKGVGGIPRGLMYTGIIILLVASTVMIIAKQIPGQTLQQIKDAFALLPCLQSILG